MSDIFYLVEGGKALEVAKGLIKAVDDNFEEVAVLARELGVTKWFSDERGRPHSVELKTLHPDFTKPSKGRSYPKRGTEWEKKFQAVKGFDSPSRVISKAFNIPLTYSFKDERGSGSGIVSDSIFEQCGILAISDHGPFAFWIPNLEEAVKPYAHRGLENPHLYKNPEIDGARRIHKKEWEIMVLQHELKEIQNEEANSGA